MDSTKVLREAMLAYQAVYDEDLREEVQFENWVNSLVEEGYDLSGYTWEDMYEAYLSEMGTPGGNVPGGSRPISKPAPAAKPAPAKPLPAGNFQQTRSTGRGTSQTRTLYRSSSDNKVYANYNDALAARNSRMNSLRGAQDMLKGKTPAPLGATPAQRAKPLPGTPGSAAPRPAAPAPGARPAAPAPGARPAAPAPGARPAASAPATRPAATPAAKPAPTAPAAKPYSGPGYKKDTSVTDMIGRSQIRQGAPINTGNKSSDIRSMAMRGTASGGLPTSPTSKPAPTRPMGSRKPGSIVSGFDLFDVVKGYLLDEGYADTEEAALVIMANMSEDWRQSIIEGGINFSVPSRIDDFNNRRDELKNRYKQDVGPRIPGPGGGGQYGEPAAPKAMGVRLASSSKKGVQSKNNA